jgi:hypothetical protein
MSKSKTKARSGFGQIHWGRIALVWAVALGSVFYLVPRENLPEFLKGNSLVVAAYGLKSADKGNAAIEPAAGETGYKTDDRRELDSLISRGDYQ